jgi:arylsulfatase A-like enzyme
MKKRVKFINVLLLMPIVALLVSSTEIPDKSQKSDKPNFILILADDLGWSCMSALMDDHYAGSKSDYFETPNIDRLASMGMRLTSGYAPAALCCPTRRSIQFGQTPIRQSDENFKTNYHPDYHKQLTIPNVLKAADPNYKTAHYGKCDLRADIFPEDLGYDESDGNTGNNNGDYGSNKITKWTDYFPSNDPKRIESLTNRANNFMERKSRAGNPFYLQLSHYATHVDMQAKQETHHKYVKKEKGVKHSNPAWGAMLNDLDTGIGSLLSKVKELGIEDNTYLIFMTDNGAAEFIPPVKNKLDHPSAFDRPMRNYPLRGGKWVLYEGGIRVPFMVVGPGIEAGSQCEVPVAGWDILPTLADLSGSPVVLPDDLDEGSFAAILENGDGKVERKDDVFYFHRYHRSWPHSAIRVGNDKLIRFWKTNKIELYDLSTNLGETKDLANEFPDKVKALNERLEGYIKKVDAEIITYLK